MSNPLCLPLSCISDISTYKSQLNDVLDYAYIHILIYDDHHITKTIVAPKVVSESSVYAGFNAFRRLGQKKCYLGRETIKKSLFGLLRKGPDPPPPSPFIVPWESEIIGPYFMLWRMP